MRASSTIATAFLTFAFGSAALADVVTVPTRFGTLTIERLDNRVNFQGRVFFKGHPLHPDVRGNDALYVSRRFHLDGADAVLFEDLGGEACPHLWYFVTVKPSGATSTPEFGSCGTAVLVSQKGQTIVVRTQGFLGPFEPQAARLRAAKETHEFLYRSGVVTENGKPVPCGLACK